MPPDDDLLEHVADAILDGTPVDWAAVESRTDGTSRGVLGRLRVLSQLAHLHRHSPTPSLTPESTVPAVATTATAPPIGESAGELAHWGHLRLLERIGHGASGQVYRAYDTRLDRDVALKLLPAHVASGGRRGTSIIEEGRLLARVRHPNVVIIHDAERIGDQVGLSMELVGGLTLEQMLEHGTRFTVAETVTIGLQLCQAMAAVHEAGLLHRDIKAQNIMMTGAGRVVLMDFGTGCDPLDGSSATLAGTPLYLAPELLRGSAPTVQSDIYSLGVLLYHLLTRSYPVQAENLGLLRAAHELREGFGAGMLVHGLPRRLGRIIDRAIRPHPGERYGDVESVAADLMTVSAPRRRASVVSAAAVAVLLCIAAVWWGALGQEAGGPAAAVSVSSSNVVLPFKPSAATSPEAHRHYLFGRYHMEIRRPDRMLQAEQEFREALKIDPRYADAHAALSLALVHTAWLGARRGIDVMGPAKDAAMQALAIDDSVALAYTSLGNIYELFEYDHLRSQAAHLRALALDRSDLWVLRAYASFLMRRDAVDEALAVIQNAIELDPASPLSNRHRAMMLYTARRYDECVALTRRTLALDPENATLSYSWLARCLEAQGKFSDAVDAFERGRRGQPGDDVAGQMRGLYAVQGWKPYWREQLRRLPPYGMDTAAALVRLGNYDEAIQILLELQRTRTPTLGFLNMPEFDALRPDARFQALRHRSGLSEDIKAQLAAARAGSPPSR